MSICMQCHASIKLIAVIDKCDCLSDYDVVVVEDVVEGMILVCGLAIVTISYPYT